MVYLAGCPRSRAFRDLGIPSSIGDLAAFSRMKYERQKAEALIEDHNLHALPCHPPGSRNPRDPAFRNCGRVFEKVSQLCRPCGARRLITCLPSVETLGLVMLSPSGTGVRLGNKSGSEIVVVAFPALKGWAILCRPRGARRLITCLSSVERLGYVMLSLGDGSQIREQKRLGDYSLPSLAAGLYAVPRWRDLGTWGQLPRSLPEHRCCSVPRMRTVPLPRAAHDRLNV